MRIIAVRVCPQTIMHALCSTHFVILDHTVSDDMLAFADDFLGINLRPDNLDVKSGVISFLTCSALTDNPSSSQLPLCLLLSL